MIYEYFCENCNLGTDIIKALKDFERIESCTKCGTIMRRAFVPKKTHLFNTAVQEAYFHPSLGQVVKGDNHAKQLAKEKKWVEVGNESPAKHLKVRQSNYDD